MHTELNSQSAHGWYLFVDGGTVGPLSLADMQARMLSASTTDRCLVWREGMKDWLPMLEVDELTATADFPLGALEQEVAEFTALTEPLPAPEKSWATDSEPKELAPTATLRRWPKKTAAVAAVVVLGSFMGLRLLQVRHWMFPHLEDISRAEAERLESVALSSLHGTPSFAIAISSRDPETPLFYIATNLPDGSVLQVHIEGIPETLLGRTQVAVDTTAAVKGGLATTPVLIDEHGKPYPAGRYAVSVHCPNCSHDATAEFAVGESQGPLYESALQVYHSKVRAQAETELVEVTQFAETLEHQLLETMTRFQNIGAADGHISALGRARWKNFNREWSGLEKQMDIMARRWTDSALTQDYFYGKLYALLRQSLKLMDQIHGEQDAAVAHGVVTAALSAQTAAEASVVQSSLLTVRTKVALMQRLSPTANGMPQRTGL